MQEVEINFIVGMSRCEITWLSRCINSHPDAAVFGQSRYWGRFWVEPNQNGKYGEKELGRILQIWRSFEWDATIGGEEGCLKSLDLEGFKAMAERVLADIPRPASPEEPFKALAREIARRERKKVVFEKTPHHINWMERILRYLPGSRFIVLRCDPYRFIKFHKAQKDIPFHPIACALLWRGYMIAIEEAIKRRGDLVVVVDVERLMDDPSGELDRALDFFGLSRTDLATMVAPGHIEMPRDPKSEPGPEDYFWMNLIGSKIMRENNLEIKKPGSIFFPVAKSILLFAPWAFSILRQFKNEMPGSVSKYLLRWFI